MLLLEPTRRTHQMLILVSHLYHCGKEREKASLLKTQVGLLDERLRVAYQELSVYRSLDVYHSSLQSELQSMRTPKANVGESKLYDSKSFPTSGRDFRTAVVSDESKAGPNGGGTTETFNASSSGVNRAAERFGLDPTRLRAAAQDSGRDLYASKIFASGSTSGFGASSGEPKRLSLEDIGPSMVIDTDGKGKIVPGHNQGWQGSTAPRDHRLASGMDDGNSSVGGEEDVIAAQAMGDRQAAAERRRAREEREVRRQRAVRDELSDTASDFGDRDSSRPAFQRRALGAVSRDASSQAAGLTSDKRPAIRGESPLHPAKSDFGKFLQCYLSVE